MKNNDIIKLIIFIIILILFSWFLGYKAKFNEKTQLISGLTDSLTIWKNKDSTMSAKIQILETYKLKTFTKLNSQDSTMKELLTLVKENKNLIKRNGSATIIKTVVKFDTITNTIIEHDTNGNIVYKGKLNNKWISLSSISTLTETNYDLTVKSSLRLITGEEKQGLFKKRKPYAIINDKNPYTDIKDLKTYQIKLPAKKRIIIGPSIGYGIIFTNTGVKSGIIVGGTITYNLIQF